MLLRITNSGLHLPVMSTGTNLLRKVQYVFVPDAQAKRTRAEEEEHLFVLQTTILTTDSFQILCRFIIYPTFYYSTIYEL
jgi:hypothetical protein